MPVLRTPSRSIVVDLARLLLCAALLAGCGGETPAAPAVTPPAPPVAQTGTVSGTVTRAGSTEPLAGATVRIGILSGTTDAGGLFSIANVPVRTGTSITVSRTGYDDFTGVVDVSTSGASIQVSLRPQTVFQSGDGTLYIPSATTRVRGVILCILSNVSNRGFASGNPGSGTAEGDQGIAISRQALAPLADEGTGLVLMGMVSSATIPGGTAVANIRQVLCDVARTSGRDELASAPLFLYAVSAGAPSAAGIMRDAPDQVVGFFFGVPTAFGPVSDEMLAIPGYLALANGDTQVNNAVTESAFSAARARGARWALVTEFGRQHLTFTAGTDYFAALRGFTAEAFAARAGTTAPAASPLRSLALTSGWLGDPGSFVVTPWSAFTGAREAASWLPTDRAAQLWRAHVSRRP